MVIFAKYSNERRRSLRIRTEILEEGGSRKIRKTAADPEAWKHIEMIYERFLWLEKEFAGTIFRVNECEMCSGGITFPWLEGETLEEVLDRLLFRHDIQGVTEKMQQYFEVLTAEDTLEEFTVTPEFEQIFGSVSFERSQKSRKVSDIDMIFSNAICCKEGYELIDYEWTFDFPIPVNYVVYRCLYYYILGNAKRDELTGRELYRHFGISRQEQEQFARMEQRFQSYILGGYTPVWKLYDDISDGVIDVLPQVAKESSAQNCRTVEVYYDDGRGFGTWNWKKFRVPQGKVSLEIPVPEGTKTVRMDPYGAECVVRMEKLLLNGEQTAFTSNGTRADNGDFIFDTEDPQILCEVNRGGILHAEFYAEPLDGLCREMILNQHGKIRWMEQTKAWRLYRKLKGTRQ